MVPDTVPEESPIIHTGGETINCRLSQHPKLYTQDTASVLVKLPLFGSWQ